MYNLRNIKFKASLYDALPIILFLWGSVFALYFWLAPQRLINFSIVIVVILSVVIFYYLLLIKPSYLVSITANEAKLEGLEKTYVLEFEDFNGWRLVARLTQEEQSLTTTQLKKLPIKKCKALQWINFFGRYLFNKCLFTPHRYISIYHSSMDKPSYDYLRSFAAYQCFLKDKNQNRL